MAITTDQVTSVKAKGFLRNRGTDKFSGRVVGKGGVFTAEQLSAIAECARLYGDGTAIMTSRLCIELTGIPFENIEPASAFITEKTGLSFGGTGAKVRPITACKGTTCVFGNIDTRSLAAEIHDRYYVGMSDMKLPHKFKIGVGGCPNSCMKPSLNDFGIEGVRLVEYDMDKCRGCKVCQIAKACPMKTCQVVDGKLSVGEECSKCGVCVGKCPIGAVKPTAESAYRVYVGGTWGKHTRMGTRLDRLFSREEVLELIGRTMEWFAANGQPKERFSAVLDRIGVDEYLKAVL